MNLTGLGTIEQPPKTEDQRLEKRAKKFIDFIQTNEI
jgi:hypothetical protein